MAFFASANAGPLSTVTPPSISREIPLHESYLTSSNHLNFCSHQFPMIGKLRSALSNHWKLTGAMRRCDFCDGGFLQSRSIILFSNGHRPTRPDGSSGESFLYGFQVVHESRFSAGRAESPTRRLIHKFAAEISSWLSRSHKIFAGISTRHGSHQTIPSSRPFSFTDAMTFTERAREIFLIYHFNLRFFQVEGFPVNRCSAVMPNSVFGTRCSNRPIFRMWFFPVRPISIERNFPRA